MEDPKNSESILEVEDEGAFRDIQDDFTIFVSELKDGALQFSIKSE